MALPKNWFILWGSLLMALVTLGQEETDCKESFLCTEDFCDSQCGPKDCFIENEECEGDLLFLYENSKDFCSCCNPRCVVHLKEGDICSNNPNTPYPTEMCGRRLECRKEDPSSSLPPTCLPALTNCMEELRDYNERLENGELGMNESEPDCDEDGDYMPLQCQRGGLCRCVDKTTGAPIFGVTGSETEARESSQDCQCARNYHEALEQACRMELSYLGSGFENKFRNEFKECMEKAISGSASSNTYFPSHMRCLSNGNFDRIQCVTNDVESEDMCLCITEDLQFNNSITYQSVTFNLPCYDEKLHVPEYFRPCEAEARRIRLAKEFEMKNKTSLSYDGYPEPRCNPDGNYHHLQHRPQNYTQLYCASFNGTQIEDFEAELGTSLGDMMDCECALARASLTEGVPKPTCCANGNFRSYQCQAGQCYCVNNFGRQTSKEVNQLDIQQLNCQPTCGDESLSLSSLLPFQVGTSI